MLNNRSTSWATQVPRFPLLLHKREAISDSNTATLGPSGKDHREDQASRLINSEVILLLSRCRRRLLTSTL